MDAHGESRSLWKPHTPLFNPWKRRNRTRYGVYDIKHNNFGRFDEYIEENMDLDWATKSAALDASPYVVCLTSYTGIQRLFMCSGIIMDSYEAGGEFCSTIVTSASLLRCPIDADAVADNVKVDVCLFDGDLCEGEILGYDFHFNVAAITVKTSSPLQRAVIENATDAVKARSSHSASFQLVPHRDTVARSSSIDLRPGTDVIALGRHHDDPYHIMAAPGFLSLVDSGFDCKELRMASCVITKNGIGGPLINYDGCVIGMNFYTEGCTPFLPINIASKCLELLQNYRTVPRPWLGVKICDVDTSKLGDLEKVNQTFPNTFWGAIVREVESGSAASVAGVCADDIIVEVNGKLVGSSIEFTCMVLEKGQEPLEVVIKRASSPSSLTLTIHADGAERLNRWPIPEEWIISKIA